MKLINLSMDKKEQKKELKKAVEEKTEAKKEWGIWFVYYLTIKNHIKSALF